LSKVSPSESSVLVAVEARAVGHAVKAAIRDSRDTCAVDRGANTSYETFELDEAALAGGGEAMVDAMVAIFLGFMLVKKALQEKPRR
jgi:hypothetical protein